MSYFTVVILTLTVYWLIGFAIAIIDEDYSVYWSVGLIYPIMYVLTYPIRIWMRYSRSKQFYQKHNISRWQYFWGKRPDSFDI